MTTLPKKIEKEFDLKFKWLHQERITPNEIYWGDEQVKQFFAEHMISKEEVKEKIEKIATPPECLDILLNGKTIEESQFYIEGAEDMRKKFAKDLLKELDIE